MAAESGLVPISLLEENQLFPVEKSKALNGLEDTRVERNNKASCQHIRIRTYFHL